MTKFAPNKTVWTGEQLSYKNHITTPQEVREDLYCLTLAQSEALIAVIERYRFATRWIDDDGDVAKAEIEQFVNDTQRRLMMPCGSDNVIVMTQWTPNGHFQESTDGGVTWHDAPNHDPRLNVPLPPPFLPPDTTDETCTYADSVITAMITNWIDHTGTTEDEATVIEGIISFLAGLFGAFGVIAAAITLGLAIIIVAFTVAAWKAAFVSDVWDRLRCNLKDHMGSDGTFTQNQVDAVYTQIGSDETGIVKMSLQGMIAAMGAQGLTIAARQGRGSATADCSCGDVACVSLTNWTILTGFGAQGVIDSIDEASGTITCSTNGAQGNGQHYITLVSDGDNNCCQLLLVEATAGSVVDSNIVWWDCGHALGDFGSYNTYNPSATMCTNKVQPHGSAAFTCVFTFTECA